MRILCSLCEIFDHVFLGIWNPQFQIHIYIIYIFYFISKGTSLDEDLSRVNVPYGCKIDHSIEACITARVVLLLEILLFLRTAAARAYLTVIMNNGFTILILDIKLFLNTVVYS